MALVRWNPWAGMPTLPTLQERINRVFEDIFPAAGEREDFGLMDWRPVVDTYEKEDAVMIKADLPGVKKEDISIDIRQNVLTLSGERSHEKDIREDQFHRRERYFGRFQRSFTLPENVDPEHVDARFKDGVLEVRVPKTEKTRAKRIEIK